MYLAKNKTLLKPKSSRLIIHILFDVFQFHNDVFRFFSYDSKFLLQKKNNINYDQMYFHFSVMRKQKVSERIIENIERNQYS